MTNMTARFKGRFHTTAVHSVSDALSAQIWSKLIISGCPATPYMKDNKSTVKPQQENLHAIIFFFLGGGGGRVRKGWNNQQCEQVSTVFYLFIIFQWEARESK